MNTTALTPCKKTARELVDNVFGASPRRTNAVGIEVRRAQP